MLSLDPLTLDSAMLDEARSYLHIDTDVDDPSLGSILVAATAHCEKFTGQILQRRQLRQTISAASGWQRLAATPVLSIVRLDGIPAEGAEFQMPAESWQWEIDRNDDAFVRIRRPGAAGRVRVTAEAGIAEDWDDMPEGLRFAILRHAAHLYAHRDSKDDAGSPAAVTALLNPWRRMRLAGGTKR